MYIGGSLVQDYIICPRKAWLMSHQICGDRDNDFLSIGRMYAEETYKRDKKEIMVDGNKIDLIREDNGILTLIETKKSSKMIKAARAQLLNYLYSFTKKGFKVKGEIRVPKEKKVIEILFGEKEQNEIEKIRNEIRILIEQEKPQEAVRISACRRCSYSEFCWS